MEDKDIVREFIREQREEYKIHSEELMRVYHAFDKTVLTLSSGAIGVCLLLIKETPAHGCKVWLLAGGTLFFVLSLLAILLSYLFGILTFKFVMQASRARSEFRDYPRISFARPLQLAADTCNLCAGLFFAVGVVSITAFVFFYYLKL